MSSLDYISFILVFLVAIPFINITFSFFIVKLELTLFW